MRLVERGRLLLRRQLHLGTLLDRLALVHQDRRLVTEDDGTELTYRQAADRVARLAGGIAAKIERGDRVVVNIPSSYDQLLACLAICRAGGIAVPANPKMRQEEIDHVVADSGAAAVIEDVADFLGPPLVSAVPAPPGAVAAVFYTSGTTGKPKGARLTHQALLAQAAPAAAWPTRLHRDEAVVGLPVAHIMGFAVLLSLALAGIPTWFLRRFAADEALDAIEQRRATIFVGVPAMYRLLLEAGAEERDLRSIRVWASGADKLPDGLARRFKALGATATLPLVHLSLGQATFVEGYGMVELAGGVAAKISPPYVPLGLGDFLGIPLPPYRLRVVDGSGADVRSGQVGELWVKGPGVLQGYHGNRAATDEVLTPDGWLRTGDLARKGPAGLVFFAGRSKDVIKNGGYSVFAAEVEGVLEEHPDVVEAAVVGLADARTGEVPAAAVRLRRGAASTAADLVAFAADRLASYKAPRRIVVVDALPRTGTDKVQKDEVRRLFD